MSSKKSFYITTTLPYVNAEPHIGFAMELVHADIIARWKKSQGYDVFFNTGTDEHGAKIYKKSLEAGKDSQEYVDEYAAKFRELIDILGVDKDIIHFIRTTDPDHKRAAQEIWKRCEASGDIYKKNYKIQYCVGCELEKTDSETENGHCIIHPHLELEVREEENYFFKFSKYGQKLLELYENDLNVVPDFRLNEIKALIERGLEDFSISRLKEKMPWGVEVPGDPDHVMYVWFDALVSYISTLGWPKNEENFKKFWVEGTPTQFAGKDQVRQQVAMWQAMLMSAGIPNTRYIAIHGFLNISDADSGITYKNNSKHLTEGKKMSKSLGNVINPMDMVEEFGIDAFRLMMAGVNQFEDTSVNRKGFKLTYNNNLANGLGNLTSRIMKLAETNLPVPVVIEDNPLNIINSFLDTLEIQKSLNSIWQETWDLDKEIQVKKPWETKDQKVITDLVMRLARISKSLAPFMPETSEKILKAIEQNKLSEPLFPRKD